METEQGTRTQRPSTARSKMRVLRGTRRGVAVLGVAALALTALAGIGLASPLGSYGNAWPYEQTKNAPLLAVVGDISCQPGTALETEKHSDLCTPLRNQAQAVTANQVEALKPDLVAVLGDEQYQVGRYEDFLGSYDKTYGAFKFLQRPAPGNHEFYDRTKDGKTGETGVGGAGYFDYFNGAQLDPQTGAQVTQTFTNKFDPSGQPPGTFTQPVPRPDGQAGHSGDGWYSYDVGSWHIISLNDECQVQVGGCDPNGAWFARETQWLAKDLAANHSACTAAYWHHPTFSVADETPSGRFSTPEGTATDAWWHLLYNNGADLVLNGHDHTYARYAPMDPSGMADPKKGIREFIVGTGGESLDPPTTNANTPNLEKASGDYYGVMGLRLKHNSYDWSFASSLTSGGAADSSYSDVGTGKCHGPANG